jgi:S-adenosylmethionine synthetase
MTTRDLPINVRPIEGPPVDRLYVEVVERKGLGDPDSICDALAEAFSASLCRFYRERLASSCITTSTKRCCVPGRRARPQARG